MVSYNCSGENVGIHWGNVGSMEMMGLIRQVFLEMSSKHMRVLHGFNHQFLIFPVNSVAFQNHGAWSVGLLGTTG